MITYEFIKKIIEDETMNIINKIILGIFGIMIGIPMDSLVLLCSPFMILGLFINYVIEKIEGK